jgi:hypothetical protein
LATELVVGEEEGTMHRSFSNFKRTAVSLVIGGAAAGVHASLIGMNATCAVDANFDFDCDVAAAQVVDPGVEFQVGDALAIDLAADSLTISPVVLAVVIGGDVAIRIGGLSAVTGISGFDPGFGSAGFDLSDVSLAGGVLTMQIGNTGWTRTADSPATISFDTAVAVPVPEPATIALAALGLAAAALARRRVARGALVG